MTLRGLRNSISSFDVNVQPFTYFKFINYVSDTKKLCSRFESVRKTVNRVLEVNTSVV